MNKRLAITLLAAASVGIGLFAQPAPQSCPPPPPGPMMPRELGLSEAQHSAIQAVFEKHRAALEAKHRAAADQEKALMDAMDDPATSDARLQELQAKASAARFQAMREQRAAMLEAQALLTPEQRAKAKELKARGPREGMPPHGPRMEPPEHRRGCDGPGEPMEHDGEGMPPR